MKILIAEDDFTSRMFLRELLKSYGQTHIVDNGKEAVESVRLAVEAGEPYQLVCLDVMMPKMDGQEALREIRLIEDEQVISAQDRVKIIMTTALADKNNVMKASDNQCDYYLIKPYDKTKLLKALVTLNLAK